MIEMAAIRSFRNYVDKMFYDIFRTIAILFVTVAPELFHCNSSILELMVMLPEQSARRISRKDEKFIGWCHALY